MCSSTEKSELVTNVTTRFDLADSGDTGGRPILFLRPPDRVFPEDFFAGMSMTLKDYGGFPGGVAPGSEPVYFADILC
jgi:hypothetical protein